MGAIENAIQSILANGSLTNAQKQAQIQQTKANAINNFLTGHLPFTFTQGVWSVTITAASVVTTPLGYAISLTISLTRSGVTVNLGDRNPFVFINPPMLVPDPAGTIIRTATLPAWQGGGTVTQTYTEDPPTAFKQMFVRTLLDSIRQ